MIVADSFRACLWLGATASSTPLMGLPMAGGAMLGGVLYRAGYALPFVLVIVVSGLPAGRTAAPLARGRESADAGRGGPQAGRLSDSSVRV